MKKLMIMAAVAAMVCATQAAGFKWQAGASGNVIYDGTADGTLYGLNNSATLYLFVSAVGTGADLRTSVFNTLKEGGSISGNYTSTTLTTASKVETKEWEDAAQAGKNWDMFFVTVEDDMFLVSSLKENQLYGASTAKSVNWTDLSSNTKAIKDASAGLATTTAWYSAVPEPTSGLLLLLGIAGLALRRRRV